MHNRIIMTSLAALTLSACATTSETPVAPVAVNEPAPVSALVDKIDIPYEQFTLDNGLSVVVHTDREAPVVGVSVWYNVGSKDEPEGQTGFAHLFEHLMFNGSENAPADFFKYLDEIGATDLNGTTWFDRTNYYQTVPRGALEYTLWLESDRMGYLLGAVTQAKLDNQRGVVQNEKRGGDNQPGGLVSYEVLRTLFPEGHPYHHPAIGSMADLDAATLQDVGNWFRDKYGPNNATLVLAGDITAEEARPLVEKHFGAIERGPQNIPAAADVPVLDSDIRKVMKDDVPTTRITRYWAVPGFGHEDNAALTIGASVLGGLSASRIDNALVRGEQIATGAASYMQDFQRVGWFVVTATAKAGVDPALVEQRMDEVVADLLANGPSEDELTRSVTTSLARTIRGLEQVGNRGGRANTLGSGQNYFGNPGQFADDLSELAALDAANVQTVMQKWLSRPSLTVMLEPGERGDDYQESTTLSDTSALPADATAGERKAPRTPPEIGGLTELDFPDIQHARLSNGIKVHYAQRDTVPVTQVALSFDAGSASDPVGQRGLEELAMNLFDEGTSTMSSRELAEARERLGAVISLGGGGDRSTFTLSALSPNLAPSLQLLSDVVRDPAFDASEVERLKAQQIASIENQLRTPSNIAGRALGSILYGADSPYGGPSSGTVEQVYAFDRNDMMAFKDRWIRPDNMEIFVVSDQPLDTVLPALDAKFGDWQAPSVAKGVKTFSAYPSASEGQRIVLIDRPKSPQSHIVGGVLTPVRMQDPASLSFLTANDALGSGFLSRLNMNLREDKGWAYYSYGVTQQRENAVAYQVIAPVQANRTGEAIAEVMGELNRFLSEDGVSEEEFERIIASRIRQLPGQFETSADVLGAMQRIELYDRPDDFYSVIADRYRGETRENLDAAIRKSLNADQIVWVVVGDAEVVRPQLEKLGLPIETRKAL